MDRSAGLVLGFLMFSASAAGITMATTQRADRIVEVTVFPDRAEVVREQRVELKQGINLIEFPDLPLHLERDSLRVTARGVEATLGALEIRERARTPVETPELIAAQSRLREIESALAMLATEEETDTELRAFLAALKATTTQRISERLGDGGSEPAALQATYLFVQTGLQELGSRKIARAEKRLGLEANLSIARARLAVLKPASPVRVRAAAVEVMTSTPGPLTLRLAYLTPGASWQPAFRASLDAETGDVSLDSDALVRQSTGEDWEGVALKLSTAAPSRGVSAPSLQPWLIRPLELAQRLPHAPVAAAPPGLSGKTDSLFKDEALGLLSSMEDQPREIDAMRQNAALVQSSYNLVFDVPGRAAIPGDNADHQVSLRQDLLRGEIEYHVIPMLCESAFLMVRTKAPSTHPLLAGPIHVFAGASYLGAARMSETAPGSALTLSFGTDNRILVKRARLPEEHREAGLTGRNKRISFAYRTTIENHLATAATVILEERIPVSEDSRIEVEQSKMTTGGSIVTDDRPGILRWSLRLEQGARREIAVDYAVRFPDDIVIAGLQ